MPAATAARASPQAPVPSTAAAAAAAVAGRSASMQTPPVRGASPGTTRRTATTTQQGGAQRVRRSIGEGESELELDDNSEGEAQTGRRFYLPSDTQPEDHTQKWIAWAKQMTGDAALPAAMDRSMVEEVCENLKKVAASLEEDRWMYE